jgi:hypothetical protein
VVTQCKIADAIKAALKKAEKEKRTVDFNDNTFTAVVTPVATRPSANAQSPALR